jgi:hypothetical protein
MVPMNFHVGAVARSATSAQLAVPATMANVPHLSPATLQHVPGAVMTLGAANRATQTTFAGKQDRDVHGATR